MEALVIGATGLVGKALTQQLIASDDYSSVRVLVRRKTFAPHPKLHEVIVDFDSLADCLCLANHVFCTIGTTIKNAGSKEAFRKVDFDYPLSLAKKCAQGGSKVFCLVTSMGADMNSLFFYSQVKGEIEREISQLPIPQIGFFRPSMLVGNREEHRFGEAIGQRVMEVFDFLIPSKYKAIAVEKVAASMIQFAKKEQNGVTIIESDAIQEIDI
ncbi:MAG: oxidoreductase [Spirosomataceae bacterium]